MLSKTQGLVLHHFNYSESAVIARVFTREGGLQSFLVQGARKPRSKIRLAMFEPITLVDLVYYKKDAGGLQYIKEVACPEPYKTIPANVVKTTLALFLSEFLLAVLKQSESTPNMFDFVKRSFSLLDQTSDSISNFHLVFLIELSKHLGFFPRNNYDEKNCYFSLKEGFYLPMKIDNHNCLNQEESLCFWNICSSDIQSSSKLTMGSSLRKVMVEKIIEYYTLHLQGIKEIKSHKVLEAVLH
jgi:DNA repair protein RecO (recombination protein O)